MVRKLFADFVASGRQFDFHRPLKLAYLRPGDKALQNSDVVKISDVVTHVFEYEMVRDYAAGHVSITCEGVTVFERSI